jgi:hypothetical protein
MKTSPTVVKRGRGRPRKEPVGVFKLTKTNKKEIEGKAKKRGRPIGSKNKFKNNDINGRVDRLEVFVGIMAEMVGIVLERITSKKAK